MANTTVKGKFNVVAENGDVQTIYPKTTGDQVLVDRSSNASVIPNDVANLQHIVNKMGSLALKSKVETSDFATGTMINSIADLKSNTETGKIADATVVKDIESRVDTLENSNLVTVDELDAGLATKPDTEINDSVTSTSLTWSSKKLSDQLTTLNSNTSVLTSRVNTIIALPDGSTTNDARLEDICVGYDDTEYDSPGESVRTQISDVYDKIDARHEDMMQVNKNEFISYYKTTTHFLDKSGRVVSFNGGTSYMTDFIKCDSDDIFEYTGCGKQNVASMVWYDSDLNKISHDQYDDNEPHEVTPPEGAEYVRFCSFQYTGDVKNLKFNLVNKKYTSFIENKISDIKNIMSNNINRNIFISYYLYNGGYLSRHNGKIAVQNNAITYITDFIRCDNDDVFEYTGYGFSNTASVCWYDSNLNFISSEVYGDMQVHELTPPNNAEYCKFASYSHINQINNPNKLLVRFKKYKHEVFDRLTKLETNNTYLFPDYTREKNIIATYNDLQQDGFIYAINGLADTTVTNGKLTDFYNIDDHPVIFLTSRQQYETTIIAIYDKDDNFIASLEPKKTNGGSTTGLAFVVTDKEYNFIEIRKRYPHASKFRCSIYDSSTFELYEYANITLYNKITAIDNRINILSVGSGNVLYGKKYVSAGDSFTVNTAKPYPMWIAERNAMNLVNEARSGTTMAIHRSYFLDPENFDEENATHFANKRYKAIPDDADYLTLCFGLNETGHWPTNVNDENYPTEHPELAGTKIVPIGTSSDYTDKTTWGAWNLSLDYIIEHHPFLKIGIIIADAWMTQELHDTLIAIAKYWGIPYLDLKNGENVPLGISDRFYTTSSRARNLRTAAFRVSDNDSHPNLEAHKYRSTIIENFLRSL